MFQYYTEFNGFHVMALVALCGLIVGLRIVAAIKRAGQEKRQNEATELEITRLREASKAKVVEANAVAPYTGEVG